MGLPVELLTPGTSPQDLIQQNLRSQPTIVLAGLNFLTVGNQLKELKTSANSWNLSTGGYPALSLSRNNFSILGTAGTSVAGGFINGNGTVANVHFTSGLVLSGQVAFTNCVFDVTVTTKVGVKAIFQGCVFNGGAIVDNTAGGLLDVCLVSTIGAAASINTTNVVTV